jgi:hypothetical protein
LRLFLEYFSFWLKNKLKKMSIEKEIIRSIEEQNISLFEKTILKIKNLGEKVINN